MVTTSLTQNNKTNNKWNAADKESKTDNSTFDCNICLDPVNDAVVSLCGHLFCWPCLQKWLEAGPSSQVCPVCKAAICKETVVPLYGRGDVQIDPREKVTSDSTESRIDATIRNSTSNLEFGDNDFQFSFGIGAFPFGIFTAFHLGGLRPNEILEDTQQPTEEHFLSKMFAGLIMVLITWILMG